LEEIIPKESSHRDSAALGRPEKAQLLCSKALKELAKLRIRNAMETKKRPSSPMTCRA